MCFGKITLAAAAIAGFAFKAFAAEECPPQKIDTTGMPNFSVCKPLEPQWSKVVKCQDEQLRIWYDASKSNNNYEKCHPDDTSRYEDTAKVNEPTSPASPTIDAVTDTEKPAESKPAVKSDKDQRLQNRQRKARGYAATREKQKALPRRRTAVPFSPSRTP